MIRLDEKEFEKLEDITRVPAQNLEKLYSMRLLDNTYAVKLIIRHDFMRLSKSKLFTREQIIRRLRTYYDVSPKIMSEALVNTKPKHCYCRICRRPVSPGFYRNHDELCQDCFIQTIEV